METTIKDRNTGEPVDISPNVLLEQADELRHNRQWLLEEIAKLDIEIDALLRSASSAIANQSHALCPSCEGSPENDIDFSSMRDFVVKRLQKAYPKPIRASVIHREYEALTGRTIHPKSVGMTLYRLKTEGVAVRGGWNWRLSHH